jgi:hypothetical protein
MSLGDWKMESASRINDVFVEIALMRAASDGFILPSILKERFFYSSHSHCNGFKWKKRCQPRHKKEKC